MPDFSTSDMSAFMAMGAYATVLLGMNGVPLPLAVLAGMLLAGASGAFLGMATLRLREDYLAIVTIGFSEIIRFLLLNWSSLTKGSFGLFGYPRPGENLVGAMGLQSLSGLPGDRRPGTGLCPS